MDVEASSPQSPGGKATFSVISLIRTVFHLANFALCCSVSLWGIMLCLTLDTEKYSEQILKDLKYLAPAFGTNWNYAFQTLFLTLSLANDVLEWFGKHENHFAEKLRYWRDVVFSGLVVPFTLFVSSMFWCVYAVDRELVFPKAYDEVVPWWFNHCVHTNISVVVLVETLLQARRRPRDFKKEILFVVLVDVAYAIVYYSIYYFTQRWLYKVFGIMTWWQVCLYQLLIWVSSFVFYYIQFPINRLIHGDIEESDATMQNVQTAEVMSITKDEKQEVDKNNPETKEPFSTKSWSLKYRVKNQFENSHL